MSSARNVAVLLPAWAKSRSSAADMGGLRCSEVGGRGPVLVPERGRLRRPLDDLLEQQVHEEEEGLGLEDQEDRLRVGIVVEVLVHAAVLDHHDVAGLPRDVAAVMDVVAAALED